MIRTAVACAAAGWLLAGYDMASDKLIPKLRLDNGKIIDLDERHLAGLEFVDDLPPVRKPAADVDAPLSSMWERYRAFLREVDADAAALYDKGIIVQFQCGWTYSGGKKKRS